LDGVFKEQIKEAMLANLASSSSLVRKQVASAIAAIASIEIPRKEWLALIPNLCENSVHQDINIRSAALETLGFICEELMPEDLTEELKNKIVLALTTNINPDPQF
jgi:importin subunit beta-1